MKKIKGSKLVCVACLYKGVVYIIRPPADHQDVRNYIQHIYSTPLDEKTIDGYLTDLDEFVTMDDAVEIVKTQNYAFLLAK